MTLDLRAGLHEAARQLRPVRPDYATVKIQTGFDWSALAGQDFDSLYLVVFRSVRRPDADLDRLREHDDRAYEEAAKSGGLLRYFKGDADEGRRCLSFCLWESRGAALRASGGGSHGRAAGISAETYESYLLDRYWLKKVLTPKGGEVLFEQIRGS